MRKNPPTLFELRLPVLHAGLSPLQHSQRNRFADGLENQPKLSQEERSCGYPPTVSPNHSQGQHAAFFSPLWSLTFRWELGVYTSGSNPCRRAWTALLHQKNLADRILTERLPPPILREHRPLQRFRINSVSQYVAQAEHTTMSICQTRGVQRLDQNFPRYTTLDPPLLLDRPGIQPGRNRPSNQQRRIAAIQVHPILTDFHRP